MHVDEDAAAVESSILIEVFQRRATEARRAEAAKAPASANYYDVRIPGTRVSFRKHRDGRCEYTRASRLEPKALKDKSLLAAFARSLRDNADGEYSGEPRRWACAPTDPHCPVTGKSHLRGKLPASMAHEATLKSMEELANGDEVVVTGLWQDLEPRLIKGKKVKKAIFDQHPDDCIDLLLASSDRAARRQLRRFRKAPVSTRRSRTGSKL